MEQASPWRSSLEVACFEQERRVQITLRSTRAPDFVRSFDYPKLSVQGRTRFMALAITECVNDWHLVLANPAREPSTASSPKVVVIKPAAPAPTPPTLYVSGFSAAQWGGLPGQAPWGLGVRLEHELGDWGGYMVDLQSLSGADQASLGAYEARSWTSALAYLHSHELGSWLLTWRAGVRAGAVHYDGSSAREDVRVTPFWLPHGGVMLGSRLSWRLGEQALVGLGGELGATLVEASARLDAQASSGPKGAWAQLELVLSWGL